MSLRNEKLTADGRRLLPYNHAVTSSSSTGRAAFAWCLAFSTLLLIFIGSLVTSTGSGLAVPDWPLSFGTLFPEMTGGVFYEHGHRMVASVIGLMTVILAIWLHFTEPRRWVRRLGYFAVVTVCAQGVLGGLTVILLLPPAVSVSHAVLAQTFFMITIVLAWTQSGLDIGRPNKIAAGMTAVIFLQLILGAVMRHTRAGLAIPDFPTMGWTMAPVFNDIFLARINEFRSRISLDPVTMNQVFIHLSHRLGAVLVTLMAVIVTFRIPNGRRVIWTLNALLLCQWLLGAWTIWSVKAPYITSVHVLFGAALLGGSLILTLRTSR